MRLFRLAPAMLASAVVAAALTGACGTASAQSRSGIDSAPLLPPAGVGTPDYPGYPTGNGTQQRAQPAPPPPAPAQQQPYQGIYGIGGQTPGQGQGQGQPQGQAQQGRTARPPAGAPPAAAPPAAAPAPAPVAPVDNDVQVVPPPAEKIVNPTAVYAGLDKITGRITSFEVGMGETVQFGALQVTPRACYTRPPTEPQNTTSFTEVNEITLQGEAKRIFTGWMFASSPGLHGVEHPIYDVWLTDCKASAPGTAKPGGQK
ncbi:DUF2155 domain-containing protein [Azorhizobium doebereinerae]|uniref:DUF2155 domain-containing protein n=1 Tax=Azorhizobium doebereinerae TaxID=281091 RepID=UPI0009FD7D55|nr:DUF2155 domain-containing protein [Azorhizobium doebereinerae]